MSRFVRAAARRAVITLEGIAIGFVLGAILGVLLGGYDMVIVY